MIQDNNIQKLFFLGIGGIGMSAIARYFHGRGYTVSGYDRTPSPLTRELEQEGIGVTYSDEVPADLQEPGARAYTQVVRTPAVPEDEPIYTWLREQKFDICKRSEILGIITRSLRALCVAGTHGKTTTSTMLAHILRQSALGTNAFLGGISNNYGTNLLQDKKSDLVVVEADEYDRSFHRLTPYMSVVTSVDPDHLDIYGTAEAYREAFSEYTALITNALVVKQGIPLIPRLQPGVRQYTYGVAEGQEEQPDFYADRIIVQDGRITFDFHTPKETIADVELGVPVWVNIENSVAAMAVAWLCGVRADELRAGVASFRGVYRRFNIHVNTPQVVYIDDYAHHPQELQSSIDSVRRLYPDRTIIGIFQPHLYTRTRDFAADFARVLSSLDEVILLPIYPARERPIAGVDSEMLLARITTPNKTLVSKQMLPTLLRSRLEQDARGKVIISLGAGDIDRLVPDIKRLIEEHNG